MSFILDALKKSESDRQRQSGPSLFEVKVAPPRRRLPIWAVVIAVLLGVNAIVISWMLLRRPPAQQPAAVNAAAPTPAAPTVTAAANSGETAPAASGSSAARGAAPTPPAAPATARRDAPPPASPADQSGAQPPDVITPSDYAPAVEPAGAPESGASDGPMAELPLYQQIATSDDLPSLHLDLHVFAQRPQDRFVMINMHRLREGDSLPSGVQVDAIRPDGVVLSYRGTRFLLPRN
jgi:general secretion pathway protein B